MVSSPKQFHLNVLIFSSICEYRQCVISLPPVKTVSEFLGDRYLGRAVIHRNRLDWCPIFSKDLVRVPMISGPQKRAKENSLMS